MHRVPLSLNLRPFWLSVLAVVIALAAPPARAQDSVDLTLDQARNLATQALFTGDPQLALQVAEAILAQNPDDRGAWVIVAAAAPRTGDPARGRAAGARAWALSTTDVQKYEAARLTALAAANEERFTLSTFWLRRALTVAPTDEERARTLTDARSISRRNPWSTSLSFSLAPSNNVNGGAEDADLIIAGDDTGGQISADGLALSGWRATLGFGTQYRFQQNTDSQSTIGLSYQGVRVRITDDTQVTDEALRTDTLQLSLRHVRGLENGTVGFNLSRARFRYRDFNLSTQDSTAEHYDTTRASIDRRMSLNKTTLLTLTATRERLDYSLDAIGIVDRIGATAGVEFILDTQDRFGLTLNLGKAESDNVNYVSNDQALSLTYGWAEPVGPVSLSASAGVSLRSYPDFEVFDFGTLSFQPLDGGRKDRRVFAALNIGFPDVSYAGFTPGLRIDASRTRSNVSRYDNTTLSAGLTISSSF